MAGRKTKLTADVQKTIVRAIRAGNYAEVAARHAGIDITTYCRWKVKGEEGKAPYRQFLQAIAVAEAHAHQRAVGVISKAMGVDWKAAAWYLERKYTREWSSYRRHELTGKDGGPIQTSDITEADLDQRIAEAQARLAGRKPGDPGGQG